MDRTPAGPLAMIMAGGAGPRALAAGLAWRPGHGPTAQNMSMDVIDRLPRLRPGIEDHSVAGVGDVMSSLLSAVKGDRSYVFMGETAAVGQNRRSWTRFLPTGSLAASSR